MLNQLLYTKQCIFGALCYITGTTPSAARSREAIDYFFQRYTFTRVVYSLSSGMYCLPSLMVWRHYDAFTLPSFSQMMSPWMVELFLVIGFTQSALSYLGDTYEAHKYRSFSERRLFNALDVLHAVSFAVMGLYHYPGLCQAHVECHAAAITATVLSGTSFVMSSWVSWFVLDKSNVFRFAWWHISWHFWMPLASLYVFTPYH